jgi:hypothetical protein
LLTFGLIAATGDTCHQIQDKKELSRLTGVENGNGVNDHSIQQ